MLFYFCVQTKTNRLSWLTYDVVELLTRLILFFFTLGPSNLLSSFGIMGLFPTTGGGLPLCVLDGLCPDVEPSELNGGVRF